MLANLIANEARFYHPMVSSPQLYEHCDLGPSVGCHSSSVTTGIQLFGNFIENVV